MTVSFTLSVVWVIKSAINLVREKILGGKVDHFECMSWEKRDAEDPQLTIWQTCGV